MGISDLLHIYRDPSQLGRRTEKHPMGKISTYLLTTQGGASEKAEREGSIFADYQRCLWLTKMEGRRFRVLALITAYEDPNAVDCCVGMIREQYIPVERILIVDNSSKHRVNEDKYKDSNVTVISMGENVGISGSIAYAFPWAIDHDFDFIWTFDQDSRVMPDVLGKLLDIYGQLTQEGEQVGIISPTVFDERYGTIHHGREFNRTGFSVPKQLVANQEAYYRCDFVITSGSLFNLSEVGDESLPNPDLFIDAVDIEHSMNIRSLGKSIIVHKSALMIHSLGERKSIRTFPLGKKREVYLLTYSPMRQYYISRNQTFVMLKYITPKDRRDYLIRDILNTVGILLFCILYIRDRKLEKVWALTLGKIHGITGNVTHRWGKLVDRK